MNHPNRNKKMDVLSNNLSARLAAGKPYAATPPQDAQESRRIHLQWRMDCKMVANVLVDFGVDRSAFLDACGVPALEQ